MVTTKAISEVAPIQTVPPENFCANVAMTAMAAVLKVRMRSNTS